MYMTLNEEIELIRTGGLSQKNTPLTTLYRTNMFRAINSDSCGNCIHAKRYQHPKHLMYCQINEIHKADKGLIMCFRHKRLVLQP